MKIAFFGTPDFAVPSLRALVGEGFDVALVVTRPDKPRGRTRSTMVPPAIKRVALEEELQVLQPARPSDPEFLAQFKEIALDIGVVVAYGHILRPELLQIPQHGFVNVHASLLPALRGAAPIQHAILRGLTETGISIMRLEEGLDSGPVLHRALTPIAEDETFGELSVRMAELGALALVEALGLIQMGEAEFETQDHAQATMAPKITRDTAHIDWSGKADSIARLVRAMDPYPGAWTQLDGVPIKLFGPIGADRPPSDAPPGEVIETRPAFVVATGQGALQFLDVQPAGKRRMAAADWLRGQETTECRRFE
ncbi:MAG: methionyl-tRNA formyltransferase [Gemmatimonadetes bacterium]|nr:methionyl-tRNA formyltransferase [Gemmatimonadota bacterium]